MPAVQEEPQRPWSCTCPFDAPYGYTRCKFHAVEAAEGAALSAAVEAYMRQIGLDPEAGENEEIRIGVGNLLQPAMDAYLDAFIASPGFTINDVRAYLKGTSRG